MISKSRYAVLFLASLLSVFLFVGTASASTWTYSDPSFMMADPADPEWTIMTCGHVPYSAIHDTLGIFLNINVTDIDYYPLPLPIETFVIVNYTDLNGTVTQYDLRETNWYWNTGMYPIDLESAVHYQVGTYDIVGGVGVGQCQLIVDPEVVPVHVVSTEYGDGWQKIHYSDGKTAYSNHETYLRWDNVWIPAEQLNIATGQWTYFIQENTTHYDLYRLGEHLTIPKWFANYTFDLTKISLEFTVTPAQLNTRSTLQVIGGVNYWYITIPDKAVKTRFMWDNKLPAISNEIGVVLNQSEYDSNGTLLWQNYKYQIVEDDVRLYYNQTARNFGIASSQITFKWD